ncbi:MAG: hypothetical protein ACLU0O_08300 [Collinsella sp.]
MLLRAEERRCRRVRRQRFRARPRSSVQDTKDKDSSYSTKSGELSAGDTLWANMYDEVEDDWYGIRLSPLPIGTWTYTCLPARPGPAAMSPTTPRS